MVTIAYADEVTAYKNKLMQQICTDDGIVQMMRLSGETTSGKDMRYKKIFPWAYVPDTALTAEKYICFDIRGLPATSGVTRASEILIFTFTHQTLMRTNDGVFPDLLSAKINHILNGSVDYGLNRVELKSSDPFSPISDYHGRRDVYYVKDFNRLCGDI